MKEIITDKLRKVNSLEDRKVLKDIMSNVVMELIDYQDRINKSVEEKVFGEIKKNEEDYNIYFTINNKKDIDPLDEIFFPMIYEDLNEVNMDLLDLENNGENIVLSTIFMKCKFKEINRLIKSNREFQGIIKTNIDSYNISVKLRKSTKYLNEIDKLYRSFILNNIKWKTINVAYISKFFDVVLTKYDKLPEDEVIENIEFYFDEYDENVIYNAIPLWNVKSEMISCSTFPVPTIDKVNYEHTISIQGSDTSIGYLVSEENQEISYVVNSENEISIIADEEKAKVWSIIKIIQPKSTSFNSYPYDIISNCMKKNFINYYSLKLGSRIRTKSEIKRLVNSFNASLSIEIEDVTIDCTSDNIYEGYNMNWFLIDDFKSEFNRPLMIVTFKILCEDNYLIEDYISFLVTNIQMYFPEYKCVGKII